MESGCGQGEECDGEGEEGEGRRKRDRGDIVGKGVCRVMPQKGWLTKG